MFSALCSLFYVLGLRLCLCLRLNARSFILLSYSPRFRSRRRSFFKLVFFMSVRVGVLLYCVPSSTDVFCVARWLTWRAFAHFYSECLMITPGPVRPCSLLVGLGNSMTNPGLSAFSADIAKDEDTRAQALALSRMSGDAAFLLVRKVHVVHSRTLMGGALPPPPHDGGRRAPSVSPLEIALCFISNLC